MITEFEPGSGFAVHRRTIGLVCFPVSVCMNRFGLTGLSRSVFATGFSRWTRGLSHISPAGLQPALCPSSIKPAEARLVVEDLKRAPPTEVGGNSRLAESRHSPCVPQYKRARPTSAAASEIAAPRRPARKLAQEKTRLRVEAGRSFHSTSGADYAFCWPASRAFIAAMTFALAVVMRAVIGHSIVSSPTT